MFDIDTYAAPIGEHNYPLAVACLPGGFAARPIGDVVGEWLVINARVPRQFKETGKSSILTIGNYWMTSTEFEEKYKIAGPPNEFGFVRAILKD